MNKLSHSILLTAALTLTACGGGGGGDGEDVGDLPLPPAEDTYDPTVFNGTYVVTYRLLSNDCPMGAPLQTFNESYIVTSDVGFRGLPVNVAITNTGLRLEGFTTKGNSDGATFFTVTSNFNELPGFIADAVCQESLTIRFVNASIHGDHVTGVTRTSDIFCRSTGTNLSFDFGCTVVYEGTGDVS